MEGLSLRPKGACGSAAPEGRVPLAAEYEVRFDASDGGLPQRPKGARDSAALGARALSATERAAQLEVTDGGVTLRLKGAAALLHRKGEPCPMLNKP